MAQPRTTGGLDHVLIMVILIMSSNEQNAISSLKPMKLILFEEIG